MKVDKLKEMIRTLIEEIENEEEVDEATTTGAVDGYKTPHAFSSKDGEKKKNKRLAKVAGYSVVSETKLGKRYGDWSVTKYVPVSYDDLGSVSGGVIKLVNQQTADTLLIQHDNALRGAKWWISTKGVRVQDPKPETVIQKAIKLNEDKTWKRFLDPYTWFKSNDIFQNRFKKVPSSVIQQLIKLTKKNGDDIETHNTHVWGITPKSVEAGEAVWQYYNGHLYYNNPNFKSVYDTLIPKLVNSKNEVNENKQAQFKDVNIGDEFLIFGENGQLWKKINRSQAEFIKNVGKKTAPYYKRYGVLNTYPQTMDVTLVNTNEVNEQSSHYINVNGKKIKISDSDLKDSSKIVKLIQKADPKVGGGFDEIDINPNRIRLIPYSGHSGFSYNIIKEATNRFQQLRKEEGTPNQKIGKGIREMRKQLQEIEKFIEWYSKIKTENDLDSSQYWKRTQRHLGVMREKLNKISQKIQNLTA